MSRGITKPVDLQTSSHGTHVTFSSSGGGRAPQSEPFVKAQSCRRRMNPGCLINQWRIMRTSRGHGFVDYNKSVWVLLHCLLCWYSMIFWIKEYIVCRNNSLTAMMRLDWLWNTIIEVAVGFYMIIWSFFFYLSLANVQSNWMVLKGSYNRWMIILVGWNSFCTIFCILQTVKKSQNNHQKN